MGIKRGDLLDGVVHETNPTQILVRFQEGLLGMIPPRELERLDRSTIEGLEVGAEVRAYVVRTSSQEGYMIVSISRAREEQDWLEAEMHERERSIYETTINGYNKGGLIIRFGRLRGFIPASQISAEREQRARGETPDERWSAMLNETILVKVVEVNRARNRLILSERAATREAREKRKEMLISQLNVGEIRTGRVISLTDFGAFVDLGGADGLIHLTEMSWKHVNHPRDLLNVGDEVRVKVINVDPERKRIGLSMKSLEEDPWDEIQREYKEDQLVQGRITNSRALAPSLAWWTGPKSRGSST
ncbi:MAG: S1 RNA-binding domain-containing protein [Anaerolineae bacterium]|nr:S1 RNA-binding domain-containing protein [Anaerolineae bacterium]